MAVVLQCNNYEVINLGVMVPWTKIPTSRAKRNATSSACRASSRRRSRKWRTTRARWSARASTIPLLIGGATTSRTHTAVKIAPGYHGPVVWVPDASRSVSVCSNLLSDELREGYLADVKAEYARIKTPAREQERPGPDLTLAEARANGFKTDWSAYSPPVPSVRSASSILKNYSLAEIAQYIDWAPFFQTWELAGLVPENTRRRNRRRGGAEGARRRAGDAEAIIEGKWLTANAVFGIFPANSVNGGDDIEIYADEKRDAGTDDVAQSAPAERKPTGRPNLCLAISSRPKTPASRITSAHLRSPRASASRNAWRYTKTQHDDYNAIMLKALADRLAEAFTELLHERVRREFWGYAKDETLDTRR